MSGGSEKTLIGAPVSRPDAVDKVRGEARFADDLAFPGMLHGAVVRSPHAHARVLGIDASAALADPPASVGRAPRGRLDVVSAMPSRSSVRAVRSDRRLDSGILLSPTSPTLGLVVALAASSGETSGSTRVRRPSSS